MRALRVDRPGSVTIRVVPEPSTDTADDVLVRPLLVGLCGTDLDILDGRIGPGYVHYPITLGHEWVGELPDGGRAVVRGILPCGRCERCRAGDTHLCDEYDEIGFTRDGAAADAIAVPTASVSRLADRVAAESAVLTEPAAVAHHGVSRAGLGSGESVLVIGDGTIGLLTAVLARTVGAPSVDVLGRRAEQAELVAAAGADRLLLIPDRGARYDVAVVAAGSVEATRLALGSVRRGGRVVVLGFPGAGEELAVVVDDLVNREITVLGSFAYTDADWSAVVGLLDAGILDLAPFVTHRYPLVAFETALAVLREPSGRRGKVVLDLTARDTRAEHGRSELIRSDLT